jgi:hypothetical protein
LRTWMSPIRARTKTAITTRTSTKNSASIRPDSITRADQPRASLSSQSVLGAETRRLARGPSAESSADR